MARSSAKARMRLPLAVGFTLATVAIVVGLAAVTFQPAVASHDVDSTTLGIGDATNSAAADQSADSLASLESDAETLSDSNTLSQQASRSITVKDPDPVIVINAIDTLNANTVAAAAELGITDPLPTAPHLLPDEDDGWVQGSVSAYSFQNDDTATGTYDVENTASGRPLATNELTVAVPASQYYLLGHAVAIRYGETIVVATVTDTGGFEGYGRVLDLAPGTWKALGGTSCSSWGVRTVYYKFL